MRNLIIKKIQQQPIKKQHGAVLVMSLLMLFVLTLVGVSSINTTTMEEKMSGNTRNRHLAFQSAESAIRDAERFIEDSVINPAAQFNGAGGLYALGNGPSTAEAVTPAWWDTAANSKRTYADVIQDVSALPRYVIESLGGSAVPNDPNAGGQEEGPGAGGQGTIQIFRITAQGTGLTPNSIVVIQAHFGKRI